MDRSRRSPTSLARINTRMLAAVLIVFELVIVATMMVFLMIPLVRRSADDLAGLMLISAQTWSELPPETRSSFEEELIRTHWLSLREELPDPDDDHLHGIYLYFLEHALSAKTGISQHFVHETVDDDLWFWARLPSGGKTIAVGLPAKRIGTHPLLALVATFLAGLLLAIVAAIGLARRITRPLTQLEAAVADVGKGNLPALSPDQWPTELAALGARVNQMARQVRELLAARTTLLAGVSHDLRTPLARMRLALALLEEAPDPVQIQRLERDIETMDQLIGRILDLARGLDREAFQEVSVPTFLQDIVASAASDRVSLKADTSFASLTLPPLALRRIVANLLENALRYAPDGLIEVLAEPTANGIRIGVLDRGPGIPADQLEAVFAPFHRLESSRSPVTGGSGLGLAIVRQLAELYGWEIELCNRAGGGLAAQLIIPATD